MKTEDGKFLNGDLHREVNWPGGCRCTLFNRHGGVSRPPWDSLNIGYSVGDDREDVAANRQRVKRAGGVSVLVTAKQVHGDTVHVVHDDSTEDLAIDSCDSLITDRQGVGLFIQHADCQAIMLYDPVKRVIGAIHSGWRGSVLNIAAKTVTEMTRFFDCAPSSLLALISPSLGPCCAEFVNYREELPESFTSYMVGENHFDFWQITRKQLSDCGVLEGNISLPDTCTKCSGDFFSHRRAVQENDGITGRNCSLIMLQ